MTGPDPHREPQSETPEKEGIGKTHEEFINDEARPSVSKQEYERVKRDRERQQESGRPGEEES